MFSLRPSGLRRIYRGDLNAWDAAIGDVTLDGSWNELDLSAILPVNAKWVTLVADINSPGAGNHFKTRKKGNTNAYNTTNTYTPVAGQPVSDVITVPVGADGIIEYWGNNVAWTVCNIYVMYWEY